MAKAAKQIPGSMTVVDMKTGNEEHKPMAWGVLPPAKDKCQICAVKHEPGEPHNAQSMFYQITFNGMVGRPPTWADAMAHCDDATKAKWKGALGEHWSAPADEAPVKHHGVEE